MAKIELTLNAEYVPDWGSWEGIREIMQNAMDEHDRGNQISVEHRGKTLQIGNLGSELTVNHLLIGYSDKREDKKMRGEKGEGLDLGLLALIRAGFDVQVQTPTENWTPVLDQSTTFPGQKVLFIMTRKVQKRRMGTFVVIKGVEKELWSQMKVRFLDFHDMGEDDKITVQLYGDLLINPLYAGKIYVKGIYVQTEPDMRYGYNFHGVKLDRDRRMVDNFDLKYTTSTILSNAMNKRPELLRESVWSMLNDETKDVSGFGQYTDSDTKTAIANMFKEVHGKEAVAVSNMGESEEMASYGATGVVVPKAIREVVAGEVETPSKIREKASKTVEETFSWNDLDEGEQLILKNVSDRTERALNICRGSVSLCQTLGTVSLLGTDEFSVMGHMEVVRFVGDSIRGLYDPDDDMYKIARTCLKNYFLALQTVIHEISHRISGSADVTIRYENAAEELWTAVLFVGDGEENHSAD